MIGREKKSIYEINGSFRRDAPFIDTDERIQHFSLLAVSPPTGYNGRRSLMILIEFFDWFYPALFINYRYYSVWYL